MKAAKEKAAVEVEKQRLAAIKAEKGKGKGNLLKVKNVDVLLFIM